MNDLLEATPQRHAGVHAPDSELTALLERTRTVSGKTLLSLLDEKSMLLVFLRHFGCAFCRRTIHDVARAKPTLDRRGVRPVFVHMASPDRAAGFFRRFGLPDVEQVSDPEMTVYTAPEFHLVKSTALPHFFGARAYMSLLQGPLWRYGVNAPGKEDKTQLPGVFFLKNRAIYRAFRHRNLNERPDYGRFGV